MNKLGNRLKITRRNFILAMPFLATQLSCNPQPNTNQSINTNQSKLIIPISNLFRERLSLDYEPKTLQEILNYNYDNFVYTEDTKEYWPSPTAMIEKAKKSEDKKIKEDCDGATLLNAYHAERQGYPPIMLLLSNKDAKESHMVALLKKQTKQRTYSYGMLDREMGFHPTSESIEKLIGKMNKIRKKNNELPYTKYETLEIIEEYAYYWKIARTNLFPRLYVDAIKIRGIIPED